MIPERGSELRTSSLYPRQKVLLNLCITGLNENKEGMFATFGNRLGDKDIMTGIRISIQINLTHRLEAMR